MSENDNPGEREEVRKEIRDALRSLRKEAERVGKDLQTVVDSTQKFLETKTPVVSSTIEDSLEKASEAFKRAMNTLDQQTRPQQVRILENYKVFLETQLTRVEKDSRISQRNNSWEIRTSVNSPFHIFFCEALIIAQIVICRGGFISMNKVGWPSRAGGLDVACTRSRGWQDRDPPHPLPIPREREQTDCYRDEQGEM